MKIFISVSATAVLYHATSMKAAAGIARAGFELKPAEGTVSEQKHGTGYYLSCARSMTGRYFRRIYEGSWTRGCVLVLDGTALSQKYKIAPVDYWQAGHRGKELEDRVWSSKPVLPGKYVTEVHLQEQAIEDYRYSYLTIYRWCLVRKIPIFVYTDHKDMFLLRRSKSIRVKPTQEFFKEEEHYRPSRFRDPRDVPLRYWIELWKTPVSSRKALHKDAIWRIDVASSHDGENVLNADLHNAKGGSESEKNYLQQLVNIMRVFKLTPATFLQTLSSKWNVNS